MRILLFLFTFLFLFQSSQASASIFDFYKKDKVKRLPGNIFGAVVKSHGKVVILRDKQRMTVKWLPFALKATDIIITGSRGRAYVELKSDVRVIVNPNSALRVTSLTSIDIVRGKTLIHVLRRKLAFRKTLFRVKTKTAIIGIKGTKLRVDVAGTATDILLQKGNLKIESPQGKFLTTPKNLKEEFRQYADQQRRDFLEYQRQLNQEFTRYVKSFDMSAGESIHIRGQKAKKARITNEDKKSFQLFQAWEDVKTETP
jgi:hypothetical protein